MDTEQKKQTIETSMDFSANVESLFKAWTDAEQLKQWWHPNGNSLENVTNELQEGGAVAYHFAEAGLKITGNYKEVVPNEKLVYSWNWELADQSTEKAEYVLTINFKSTENGSAIHVLQEGFAKPDDITPHEDGWKAGLESLKNHLEQSQSSQSESGSSLQNDSGSAQSSSETSQANSGTPVNENLESAESLEQDRSGGYNELPDQAKVGGG
jgi:uncharacterized protein YndB with AHSA1/START domain